MISILRRLFDKLNIFNSARTNSPSKKMRNIIKKSEFGGAATIFMGNEIYGNHAGGVNINMPGAAVRKEDLSTHQRIEVEGLRTEWSRRYNLIRSVNIYTEKWATGELEWINQRLRELGRKLQIES